MTEKGRKLIVDATNERKRKGAPRQRESARRGEINKHKCRRKE